MEENSYFANSAIVEMLVNLVVTIAIYSLPIFVYRYVIRKKPVEKRTAKIITGIYGITVFLIISILIFTLNGNGVAGGAIVFWSYVNYRVLISGEANAVESPGTDKKDNNLRRAAIIRLASAVVLSVLLLAICSFAPIKLISGAKQTKAIQDNEFGDFVRRDIYSVLGFYADDKKDGEVTGRYAVVPMNGQLVTVHFTRRYLESADAVCDATYEFINGNRESLNVYCTVEGTVEELDNDASGLMYDWFSLNYDQLVEMKMIAETDDYADYVTDYVLQVDTVDGRSMTFVTIMGVLSATLLAYAIVELILILSGFYTKLAAKRGNNAGKPEEKI